MPVNPAADVADLIEREKQRESYSLRDNALLPYDPPDSVFAIAQGERIPVKDVEHMRSLCNQLRVTHSYIVRLQRDWDIHNGLVPVATEEIQKPVLAGNQARKPRPVYKAPVRTAADVRRSQLFEAKLQRAQAKREAEADAKHAREQKAQRTTRTAAAASGSQKPCSSKSCRSRTCKRCRQTTAIGCQTPSCCCA